MAVIIYLVAFLNETNIDVYVIRWGSFAAGVNLKKIESYLGDKSIIRKFLHLHVVSQRSPLTKKDLFLLLGPISRLMGERNNIIAIDSIKMNTDFLFTVPYASNSLIDRRRLWVDAYLMRFGFCLSFFLWSYGSVLLNKKVMYLCCKIN